MTPCTGDVVAFQHGVNSCLIKSNITKHLKQEQEVVQVQKQEQEVVQVQEYEQEVVQLQEQEQKQEQAKTKRD